MSRFYTWDVEGLKDIHVCSCCKQPKQRKHFGTVNTFRVDEEGEKVKYFYRRRDCKECRNIQNKTGVKPTTTTL
jgi:hypothetical protein